MLTEALWLRLRVVMDMQTATSLVKDWLATGLRAYALFRNEREAVVASIHKFRDLARELECDEDEAAFEDKVRKVAGVATPSEPPSSGEPEA